MSGAITLMQAVGVAGTTLTLMAAFLAWMYREVIWKNISRIEEKSDRSVDELTRRLEKQGDDLSGRIKRLEEQLQVVDKDVDALKRSESERSTRLTQGLEELEELVDELRGHIDTGDLDASISAAQALVRALQVAATLAKLGPIETQDRVNAELSDAESTLRELMKKRGDQKLPAAWRR